MKSTLSHSILACCISRMLLSFDSVNLQPKHVEPPSDEASKLYNRASSPTWYCRERFSTSAITAEVKAIHGCMGELMCEERARESAQTHACEQVNLWLQASVRKLHIFLSKSSHRAKISPKEMQRLEKESPHSFDRRLHPAACAPCARL